MDDICTYRIELQGQLDENDLTPASPLSFRPFSGQVLLRRFGGPHRPVRLDWAVTLSARARAGDLSRAL